MNNRRGKKKRRAHTLELSRMQAPKLEVVTPTSQCTEIAVVPPSQQIVVEEPEQYPGTAIEPNTNLFAAGHIVNPMEHLYDFALAEHAEESAGTKSPCCEYGTEDETRFPESREVYLGLLGLLNRQRPSKDLPPNSECCEHDMAEWFLKRRLAYRPAWGGKQEKS